MSMTSIEQPPPSPYELLYVGFGKVAARGAIDYGPLDATFEPGDDGTRTPDGGVAHGFDHTLKGESLPQAVRDRGIDEINVWQYACAVVNQEIWPASVRVRVHESIGINKVMRLTEDEATGDITASLSVDPDDLTDEAPAYALEANVQDEIIQSLLRGELHWLKLDGAEGDFARFIHLTLTAPDEPGIDEIELLNFILQELNR